MKYVIVIPDGVADEPQADLGNRTPLQAADTPHADALAKRGVVGRANHTPKHLTPGSDVANLSLFGYDPNKHFTGRAPLEAAAQDISLGDDDWVIRCNLVTIQDQVMRSFTAGHISSEQAKQLLVTAQQNVSAELPIEFVAGVSYRNLAVWRPTAEKPAPFSRDTRGTPPHDLTDKPVADDFPRGPGSGILSDLMSASVDWFAEHPVNRARVVAGELPATNMWLWGLGKKPKLESFERLHGVRGAMITAVDLLRGLAKLIGWENISVPGATGYIDTDYAAKGKHAVDAIRKFDLVVVHVEATDEASHEGRTDRKIAAMESIDHHIIGPVMKALESSGQEWRMLVTPDHPTFLRTKTHTHGDVPFVLAGTGVEPDSLECYDEANAASSTLVFDEGWNLMPWFIGGKKG